MADIRDLLGWIYDGSLDRFLEKQGQDGYMYKTDTDRVMAFGTSSGGFLALALVCLPI